MRFRDKFVYVIQVIVKVSWFFVNIRISNDEKELKFIFYNDKIVYFYCILSNSMLLVFMYLYFKIKRIYKKFV